MGPNVKFLADRGLHGYFTEGSSYAPGSDLAKLKSYLMAKQLWNPERNATHTIAEFLVGYCKSDTFSICRAVRLANPKSITILDGHTGGDAVKVYMDTMSQS